MAAESFPRPGRGHLPGAPAVGRPADRHNRRRPSTSQRRPDHARSRRRDHHRDRLMAIAAFLLTECRRRLRVARQTPASSHHAHLSDATRHCALRGATATHRQARPAPKEGQAPTDTCGDGGEAQRRRLHRAERRLPGQSARPARAVLPGAAVYDRSRPPRLLVIVRDPTGVMHDDFFLTTDLEALPGDVASLYAGRSSIECVNREMKQCLHPENPRVGKARGPSAPRRSRCGSTLPSGAVTSPPSGRLSPGRLGPGTRRRRHRASSTHSQHCGAACGLNKLQRVVLGAAQPESHRRSTRQPHASGMG